MGYDNDGLVLKVLGGSMLSIYWLIVSFQYFVDDEYMMIFEVTIITHTAGFLLILIGWVVESNIVQNKIEEISNDVSDNKEILDIIEDHFRQQKPQ